MSDHSRVPRTRRRVLAETLTVAAAAVLGHGGTMGGLYGWPDGWHGACAVTRPVPRHCMAQGHLPAAHRRRPAPPRGRGGTAVSPPRRHRLVADRAADARGRRNVSAGPRGARVQRHPGQPHRAPLLQPSARQRLWPPALPDARRLHDSGRGLLRPRRLGRAPGGRARHPGPAGAGLPRLPGRRRGLVPRDGRQRSGQAARLRRVPGPALRRLHQHPMGARRRLRPAAQGSGARRRRRHSRARPARPAYRPLRPRGGSH